ncbi:hypothetical protein RJT34_14068 [Clitoria ternatea]|uniref:Major facilitator superfamily (MFS) profile domain-containing protein n=1 Tax=Clitoria ternatea TaxID=43366 RepID=A0AAN9JS86_CLITE
MNVITFYAPVLFKTIGFGATASLMSAMITGACNLLATGISISTVDKFGRRTLFMEGGIQMFISQVLIALAIALKFGVNGDPGVLPKWYAITVVVMICIYVAGFAWSWGPLGWLVPSEIFPLEVRSAAQSLNVSVNMIFTFFIAQVFTTMLCHMKFGLFIFFAFFVLVMTIFIYKLLPETKGVPIEEMSVVWQKHPYWTKFVKPAPSEDLVCAIDVCMPIMVDEQLVDPLESDEDEVIATNPPSPPPDDQTEATPTPYTGVVSSEATTATLVP